MISNNFTNSSSGGSIPTGVIVMWSGATTAIPSGWALCNGQNGTPNLVDRFIVGAGSTYSVGATGGSASVTLTTAQMPSHTHTMADTGGTHTHKVYYADDQVSSSYCSQGAMALWIGGAESAGLCSTGGGDSTSYYVETDQCSSSYGATSTGGAHTHTVNSTGSGSSHENRPPYYALAYIMKL